MLHRSPKRMRCCCTGADGHDMYARSTRRKSGRLIKKKEETPRGRIELDSKIDLTENDTHTNWPRCLTQLCQRLRPDDL